MSKTDIAKSKAIQIRDEVEDGRNTARRVGEALLSVIEGSDEQVSELALKINDIGDFLGMTININGAAIPSAHIQTNLSFASGVKYIIKNNNPSYAVIFQRESGDSYAQIVRVEKGATIEYNASVADGKVYIFTLADSYNIDIKTIGLLTDVQKNSDDIDKLNASIASTDSKVHNLEHTLVGGESKKSVNVNTSTHEFITNAGERRTTSSEGVSLFEYNLNKGEKVEVKGKANTNWSLLAIKESGNYTPITIGNLEVGQIGEFTATNNCTVAFTFWNTEEYSMVISSRNGGILDSLADIDKNKNAIAENKNAIADNKKNIKNLDDILNSGGWREDTNIDTSTHAYVRSADGIRQNTSSTKVSLFEFPLKAGHSVRVVGYANANWAILSVKSKNGYNTIVSGTLTESQIAEYTATEDCTMAFNFWNDREYSLATKEDGLVGLVETLREDLKGINVKVKELEGSVLHTRIDVKKSGGDFSSVTAAINHANTIGGVVDIYIHDGVYDVYQEQGGAAWISTIQLSNGERQGLYLADNVNLYGVGHVELRFELPDNVTYDQSRCVSCLNLWNSNVIENIDFYAKNCRYAIHDETIGGNYNIKRYVKDCRLVHLGCADGLWPSRTAMGGGASGGSQYDWINCQFITHGFFQAFSYHTNHNENPSHFNIDGCVGLCLDYTGASQLRSFCAQYQGTNHTGISVFNFKNCTGNGDVVKRSQSEGSEDHIEVYVNGYNKIVL